VNVSTLSLTFEYGIGSDKNSEGLDFYHFYVSPCIYSTEHYDNILYLVVRGEVPSFQCKMRFYQSISTRDRDGLGLSLNLML
jgi:hypothetical protein